MAKAETETADHGQTFGTEGITPMERPSAVTRFFMGIVNWAEKLNLKYAIHISCFHRAGLCGPLANRFLRRFVRRDTIWERKTIHAPN